MAYSMSNGLEGPDVRPEEPLRLHVVQAFRPALHVVGSNRVDFDPGVARQTRDLNRRASRTGLRETGRVHLVELGEVVHVRKKYRGSDHMIERQTRSLQQRGEIVHDAPRLDRHGTGDDLTGRRIDWNLTGKK